MDTKKLAKIIKVIVEHELKKQLPTLIEEGVKSELKRRNVEKVKTKPQIQEEVDPFSLVDSVLAEDRLKTNDETPIKEQKHFTKNAVLNEILNNTKPFGSETPSVLDKTVSLDSNIAPGGLDGMRAQMAQKMGYGDVQMTSPKPNTTGVPVLDKALTRDYSELVKRFKTRK